ncbi:hypothetical protein HYW44_01545 [Candidatus Daviesbacteria bacterium]|nr:hypothetical protein [Candidatus Daviesbacteria bacterium]
MKSLLEKSDQILKKRQKIIFSTIIITLGFILVTQPVNILFKRYYLVVVLGGLSYILILVSLWKGMTKTKAVLLLILPTFYIVAFPGFYFLFKYVRWLTRLPAALFFGVSLYWLILSQNILNVAADRAIPLYRAASTANFVYTIFSFILIVSIVFSLNLDFYFNGLSVALISFPLSLQSLWSIKMDKMDSQIVIYSFVISLILGESAVALSFWPQSSLVTALYVNSIYYIFLGILSEYLRDRLKKRVIIEYGQIGFGLMVIIFFLTNFFK